MGGELLVTWSYQVVSCWVDVKLANVNSIFRFDTIKYLGVFICQPNWSQVRQGIIRDFFALNGLNWDKKVKFIFKELFTNITTGAHHVMQ